MTDLQDEKKLVGMEVHINTNLRMTPETRKAFDKWIKGHGQAVVKHAMARHKNETADE